MEQIDIIKILVIGKTGQGKSTFINKLLGKDLAKAGGIEYSNGLTKEISQYNGKIFDTSNPILLYDTPGFGDQDIDIFDIVEQIENSLSGQKINYAVYIQRADDYRIEDGLKLFLQICNDLIEGEELKNKMIIILSHCDKISDSDEDIKLKFLDRLNLDLKWGNENIFLFNKNNAQSTLADFVDYITYNKNSLSIKEKIPLQKIYDKICDEYKNKKDFYSNEYFSPMKISEKIETEYNKLSNEKDSNKFIFEVVFTGQAGVGKTCLINRITNNNFQDTTATIGEDMRIIKEDGYTFHLWDTCGQERFASITAGIFKKADIVMLVFSLCEKSTFEKISDWLKVIGSNSQVGTLVILIGNKSDAINKIQVKPKEIKELVGQFKLKYFEISVKNDINIKVVKDFMIKEAIKTPDLVNRKLNKTKNIVIAKKERSQSKRNCFDSIKKRFCNN